MTDQVRLTSALSERYRIVRELGAGGMATVYLAEDVRHHRQVALKVLRPELAAVIGADRFLREIETTARLHHPHILPLHDSGSMDGTAYYVMPYVPGESLRDRLNREKQLPLADAVKIATEVATALDYAHRHGVVHRDIKPENILLHDSQAFVADFGIALAVTTATGGTRMTETGMSLGTPHYMSPEQAMGERDITPRSDVYALAAVLYEMLIGEPPFTGPTAQAIVARVLTDAPRSITLQRKTIPAHIDATIRKALEKLPADRFGSAAEFAASLAGSGEFARVPVTEPLDAGTRRRWVVSAAIAAGLVGGIIVGAAGMAMTRPAGAIGAEGQGRMQLTFTGGTVRTGISPDGQFVAFVNRECQHGDEDLCTASLLTQDYGTTRAVPVLDGQSFGSPHFSHDGSTIFVRGTIDSARSGLFAVPRLGGSPRLVTTSTPFDTHAAADSLVLVRAAAGNAAYAVFMNATTGSVADSVALNTGEVRDVAWSPNGKLLAIIAQDGRILIVDRAGRTTDSLMANVRLAIRWTTAGNGILTFRIGAAREDDFIQVPVNGSGRITGQPRVVIPRVQTLYNGAFDIARRTGRMSFVTGDVTSDVWSFRIAGSRAVAERRSRGTTWYGAAAPTADGKALYYPRGDALGDNVYRLSLDNGREEALTSLREPGNIVVPSADGRRLAFSHGGAQTKLTEIQLPSGATRTRVVDSSSGWMVPLGASGYLDGTRDRKALAVYDSFAGSPRLIPLPANLPLYGLYTTSPEGDRALVVVGSARVGVSLGVMNLESREYVEIAQLGDEPLVSAPWWGTNGTMYFARWLRTDSQISIWRTSEAGSLTRVASLSAPCTTWTVVVNGSHGACLSVDSRGDVWIIDGIGSR